MNPDTHNSGSDLKISNRRSYWRALLDDLSSAPRFPEPGLWAFKLLPLIVGILVTIVLVVGDYDLRLQQAIYRAGGDSWALGAHPLWKLLYKVGPHPAIILGIAALVGLSFSWSKPRFAKWRRVYLFIVLLLFLGPAVIVNFGLKDNWGRPRPLHVDSMGGKQPFENVFVWNESREGKSFPCGHASTGFVLMAGFFVFCRHRRRLAYGWLIFGAFFGSLLGLARMLQGGHFLTDVIWVALIGHYLALALYYWLGLNDSISREVKQRRKMPVKIRFLLLFVAVASLVGILLATPYRDERSLMLHDEWAGDVPIHFKATLASGQTTIAPAEDFHVWKKSFGHGVPTSRISPSLWESGSGEGVSVYYLESPSGWFHELETQTKIDLPWERIQSMRIENHSAEVSIELGKIRNRIPFAIGPGGGVIRIQLSGNRMVRGGGDLKRVKGAELLETDSELDKCLILSVSDQFTGVIQLIK